MIVKNLFAAFTIVGILLPSTGYANNALSPIDLDTVREMVFKQLAASGRFKTEQVFLQLEDGLEPSDAFMARFNGHMPEAFKASAMARAPGPSSQVIHATSGKPGVLLRIYRISPITDDRIQVTVSYDVFSLGVGSVEYTLEKQGTEWKVVGEKQGPQG